MKKFMSVLIAISLMSGLSAPTYCETYTIITESSVTAKVIQIIDGDSIKVQLQSGETALVRLLGISTEGYNASVEYLTTRILGGNVTLNRDYNLSTLTKGNWNYFYVFYNGVNICDELVSKGLAVVDDSVAEAALYKSLAATELEASSKGSEIWSYGTRSSNTTGSTSASSTRTGNYTYEKININTATAQQLTERLSSVNSALANNIVEYRNKNPFNNIREIKFVRGVTSDVYTLNKDIMNVTTNIREADRAELETLGNITESEVDEIISYRKRSNFTEIRDLKRYNLLNDAKYSRIEDFITTSKDITEIDAHSTNYIINVNKAQQSSIVSAGFTTADAKLIYDSLTNGYSMKNVMEILAIPGITASTQDVLENEDKIHTVTNVNKANDNEMRSIFSTSDINKIKEARTIRNSTDFISAVGSSVYDDVKGMISFSSSVSSYVNLNTATLEQLVSAGLSSNNARLIIQARPIETSVDLPVNVSDVNDKVTLYTNINTASKDELRTLGLSDTVVDAIFQYVDIQPFGTNEEVRKFMTMLNVGTTYSKISSFIVVR